MTYGPVTVYRAEAAVSCSQRAMVGLCRSLALVDMHNSPGYNLNRLAFELSPLDTWAVLANTIDKRCVSMKIDLPVIPPAEIQEGWAGQLQVFSWYNLPQRDRLLFHEAR